MNDNSLPSDNDNDLVIRGEDGDPVQDVGTRMIERQSYERVVEGLALSADACMHLVRRDPEHAGYWRKLAGNLDAVRRIAVSHAGIGDTITLKQTEVVRGEAMAWRSARDRFKDGIKQAAGGMRQLATCFRMDFTWARMANELDAMEQKMDAIQKRATRSAKRRNLIWLPGEA